MIILDIIIGVVSFLAGWYIADGIRWLINKVRKNKL